VEILNKTQLTGSHRVFTRWGVPLSCLLALGCYDPDERCSDGAKFSEDTGLCVCRKGFVQAVEGCVEVLATPTDAEETEPDEETDPEESTDDTESTDAANSDAAGTDESSTDDAETDDTEEAPSGLGMSCASAADCAGLDATFCDTFLAKICLVEGCEIGGDPCPVGYECQDLSALGAGNVCTPMACDLAAEDCPSGFTCCESSIPGFPPVCLAAGCGG
jgi:hypothetical protein